MPPIDNITAEIIIENDDIGNKEETQESVPVFGDDLDVPQDLQRFIQHFSNLVSFRIEGKTLPQLSEKNLEILEGQYRQLRTDKDEGEDIKTVVPINIILTIC